MIKNKMPIKYPATNEPAYLMCLARKKIINLIAVNN